MAATWNARRSDDGPPGRGRGGALPPGRICPNAARIEGSPRRALAAIFEAAIPLQPAPLRATTVFRLGISWDHLGIILDPLTLDGRPTLRERTAFGDD
jgi:hypothetical protein